MAFRFQRGTFSSRSSSARGRRPQGVSRRQRKRQLGFETLEDRRVMSADSPLAQLQGAVSNDVQIQVQSYSSATQEGQQQILLNELYWQSLLNAASQSLGVQSLSIPTDPLSGNQWHLINVGQEVGNPDYQAIFAAAGEDINVAPVWNMGITGSGVVVAVIDTGVQTSHPDLLANLHPTLELNALDGGTDANPNALDPAGAHGTAVAGLIGAVADNDLGGSGVAPGVQLVPIRLIPGFFDFVDPFFFEQSTIDAFRYAVDEIDITNNSWGPTAVRGVAGPTFDEFLALRDSVIGINAGRDGQGVIHVFASGNDAGPGFNTGFQTVGNWGSSTYNGWVSSRYTIGVTGVDHDGFYNNIDGTVTSYPETAASVLVAAPTGSNAALNIGDDTGLGSGIYTTDLTDENGYNIAPDPVTGQEFDRDFLADTDYTSRFNGTSAAAPLVSGVIALMLEANPNLSWRDVQEILVRSARQNAEFEVPTAAGVQYSTQNTWVVNQMPVFHDPDLWDPTINPFIQTATPTLDPTLTGFPGSNPGPGPNANYVGGLIDSINNIYLLTSAGNTGIHYQPTPQMLTNGAGYTVSQGRGVYGEQIGYAHGVVDAELAVQLSQQWHTKNQNLPNELTFTSFIDLSSGNSIDVPAMEVTSNAAGSQRIPGGLGGQSGFSAFWEEYFADDPFADGPVFSPRGGYVELEVPANNSMTIETVEVKIALTPGTDTQFLDNMRVLLVSPSGTHQELNHFFVASNGALFNQDELVQPNEHTAAFEEHGTLVSTDTDPDAPLVVTFSSNRSWGERSESQIIIDPTTGVPADVNGLLEQGWQLHFENYGNTSVGISGIEIAWHGSPVGSNTQRIQGLIGVDDNRDDAFNYSRVIPEFRNQDGDPSTLRLGEVVNNIDLTHESMAANVTVVARRASDGVIVDQFVTGADGNYYFDLVPDDYIISIEDPLGRTAVDDTISPAGILKNYQTEWTITEDFFRIWSRDASLEIPVDGTGTPVPFLDGSGSTVAAGIQHINFLLDPGTAAAPEVDFTGVVFADINGDGIFNGDDVHVPEVRVYGDVNRNGQYDAGEQFTNTNINGEYSLTVPVTMATVVNIGVVAPPNWNFSDPATGFSAYFVEPGDAFTGVDFAMTPPVGTGAGNGTSQPGYLLGVVYEDINADGFRQSSDPGQSGIDVYIDSNGSGSFDIGERITTTNINGAFIFADVAPGNKVVRIDTAPPFAQINPAPGGARFVTLDGGGTVSNILFGVGNTAKIDFGDLPAAYGVTLLSENGARHTKGVYYLGTAGTTTDVDAELDGKPSADALGDDTIGSDEEGIVVDDLVAASTGHLVATASRYGGYLQGWVDFNGDFDFDDAGERILTNALLLPGDNDLYFEIPATLTAGDVFARFRYGEYGINAVTGAALIGEVEDYKLKKAAPAILVLHGPDFDEDGDVDGFDFLSWQRGYGMSGALVAASDGDSNSDDVVSSADLDDWSAEFGGGTVTASAATTGDFDEDGDTDGFDFLSWQAGFGSVSAAVELGDGDGDSNNQVNTTDLNNWANNFGENSGGAPLAASAGESGGSSSAPQSTPTLVPVSSPGVYVPLAPAGGAPIAAARATSASTPVVAEPIIVSATTATLAGEKSQQLGQQDALIAFARTQRSADEVGSSKLQGRSLQPRLETLSKETRIDRAAEVVDRGGKVNVRVLDRLFTRRQRPLVEELERIQEDERVTEAALVEVLGEEINWRFI